MSEGRVHLACGSVAELLREAPDPATWLTGAERERLATMRTDPRRAQFAAARWQARSLLAGAFGGGPADWPLGAAADAPPGVLGRRDLHLSVSHSGDFTACAVAGEPVGLDIEAPRRRRDIEGLIDLCCTPSEQVLVRHADDPAAMFYALWTVKEAWLKRKREWIAPRRLQQIEVAIHGEDARTWRSLGWTLSLCGGGAVRWWTTAPAAASHWQVTDRALSPASPPPG